MPTHTPKHKGITLSINKERLLNAPVPTGETQAGQEIADASEEINEEEDEQTEQEMPEDREDGGKNQSLIDMGVAFPKGATRNDVPVRDEEDDEFLT